MTEAHSKGGRKQRETGKDKMNREKERERDRMNGKQRQRRTAIELLGQGDTRSLMGDRNSFRESHSCGFLSLSPPNPCVSP